MSAAARYAAVLRTPHVLPLVLASMLARLPIGIEGLAVVLYLSQVRGSFAVAGLVSGGFALGAAVGAPLQSRLIDRMGQRAVLFPAVLGHAASVAALIALTELGAPAGVLAAVGLVGGVSTANVSSAMRALWPELLTGRDELVPTAFALDSVALELLFTSGPLLTAVVVALVSPAAALLLAAVLGFAGTLAFVAQPPSRRWRPHPDAGSHGRLGALRSGGVRTLMLATLPVGFGFGAIEITLPAFAKVHDAPELAGVLLATWAMASAAGGLLYGARTWGRSLHGTYLWLAAILPLGFLPALAAPGIAAMAVLILPAGMAIAPLLAAGNQLAGQVAPAGAVTEAYTWPVTALIAGFAAGAAVGGVLIEAIDWRAGPLAASVAAATGCALALARRRTLAAALAPA
jgi:MFS family permease